MRRYIQLVCMAVAFVLMGNELSAKIVEGRVVCGTTKLENVIVSDGYSLTRTNSDGEFRMKVAGGARFVYIITPSGYAADWSTGAPRFYYKIDERKDYIFDLIKTGDPSSLYNLIAVADPQPSKEVHCDEFDGAPLDDICQTVSELNGVSVGVVLGDVCFNKYHLMDRWKKSIVRAGVPFYAVPGNHDHHHKIDNDRESINIYSDNFGPANYAFFIGKDVVIMLDNIIHGYVDGSHPYSLGYTNQQLKWLRGLMKLIPEDADVYVGQHSPTNGRFYMRGGKETDLIINGQEFLNVLKGHKVTILSGHNHLNKNFRYSSDVVEHNVAAICGTWWDAYHCKDGTPRGYKVYTMDNGNLSWYYKSVGKDKDFQYEVFLPGEAQLNPDCVVVNLWDYDADWSITWFEDGVCKGEMTRVKEKNHLHKAEVEATFAKKGKPVTSWKRTSASDHYFAAKPSDSAKKITIHIQNPFGKKWVEDVNL